jgi:tRNA-uridine 2-sulfurtransferase
MKISVLLSGGVDSSVSALLLKEKGYDLVGVHLHCFDFCNPQDAEDARKVAEILDIPFYVFDLTEEFEDKVINYMIRTYEQGLTPNPDVYCNQFIKFGVFFDKALDLGYDFVASGHYARTLTNADYTRTDADSIYPNDNRIKYPNDDRIFGENSGNNVSLRESASSLRKSASIHLLASKDKEKDQTYFLWSVEKEKFSKIIFPVGDFLKSEVREIAKKYNLPTAEKKESMGICFVGQVKLREFLSQYLKPKEGKIIDTQGRILGTHPGYFYFTEGQRHGLNIKVGGGPYYVAQKIPEENLIIVAKEDDPLLYTQKIEITELNVLEKEILEKEEVFEVRFRHRQPLVKAILRINTLYGLNGFKTDQYGLSMEQSMEVNYQHKSVSDPHKSVNENPRLSAVVEFLEPQKMVAPGQSIVFYKDDLVLGGGIILKRIPLDSK